MGMQETSKTNQHRSRNLTTVPSSVLKRHDDIATTPPPAEDLGDSYSSTALRDVLDHSTRAMIARMTGGLAPAALPLVPASVRLPMTIILISSI